MTKLGRPVEIPHGVTLKVRVTRAEHRALARRAKQAHVSMSAFVRAAIVAVLSDRTEVK
jgi:predicted HicB family RNase H-like nuclease